MRIKIIVLSVCLGLLSSCGWLKDTALKILPDEERAEIDFTPKLKIAQAWSQSVKSAAHANVKYIPLKQGNAVFAADGDGMVSAFLLDSGKRIWKQSFDADLTFGVGGGGGTLMLGGEHGRVIAFSPQDGKRLWTKRLPGGAITAISSAHQGLVLVRSADGAITALASQNGRQRWKIKYPLPTLSLQGMSVPLMFDQTGIIGLDDGRLLMVSLADGQVLREVRIGLVPRGSDLERIVDIDGKMKMVSGTVYVSNYRGRTIAIDLNSDRVSWNAEISSYAGLDADDEQVYVTATDGEVLAVNRYTGSIVWRNEAFFDYELSAPLAFGEFVLVGDEEGYIYWLSVADGSILARFDTGGESAVPAFGWQRRAYVANRDGDLVVLRVSARALSSRK